MDVFISGFDSSTETLNTCAEWRHCGIVQCWARIESRSSDESKNFADTDDSYGQIESIFQLPRCFQNKCRSVDTVLCWRSSAKCPAALDRRLQTASSYGTCVC